MTFSIPTTKKADCNLTKEIPRYNLLNKEPICIERGLRPLSFNVSDKIKINKNIKKRLKY
jgi:hypothetical protein